MFSKSQDLPKTQSVSKLKSSKTQEKKEWKKMKYSNFFFPCSLKNIAASFSFSEEPGAQNSIALSRRRGRGHRRWTRNFTPGNLYSGKKFLWISCIFHIRVFLIFPRISGHFSSVKVSVRNKVCWGERDFGLEKRTLLINTDFCVHPFILRLPFSPPSPFSIVYAFFFPPLLLRDQRRHRR